MSNIFSFNYKYIDFNTPLKNELQRLKMSNEYYENDLFRCFNLSIIKFDNNTYIYCVRVIYRFQRKEKFV